MNPALELEAVTVQYGGVVAVSDVTFTIEPGTLVGLIGPNGAGKTSLIDAVTGFTRASGDVRVLGRSLRGLAPHQRAARGLRRTWQHGELFEDLTVRENLSVATARAGLFGSLRDILRGHSRVDPVVDETLVRLGLEDIADRPASELTEGHRKLVGVGRALAPRPGLLLLDEPAGGLDPEESVAIGKLLREVVDEGTAMLLIDHDMSLVMSVCDRIVVLDHGVKIAEGSPEQIRADETVVAAYLGGGAVQEGGER